MVKVVSFATDINLKKFAKKILKNEPRIIKEYPAKTIDLKQDFDGQTGLGFKSLTSRSCHYNLLNWTGTRSLRKWIRHGYEEYNKLDGPLYVLCWANVMRKGEKILPHKHESNQGTPAHFHLCGHLNIQVDGSTSTYYEGTPILNECGVMTFFPGSTVHWTDEFVNDGERITVAFDIYNEEFYTYDVFDEYKYHWIEI